MDWTAEQRKTAEKYKSLDEIPENERKYKCHTCHHIVDTNPCPNCGETHLIIMCPLDHCHCTHEIISGIEYCPLCGQAVCPECGSHDVVQVSRVTVRKAFTELAQEAKRLGKWLHMGRVNSLARIHYAESIGCDSVDGTHIIFEPRRASRRLVAWMNQKSLFFGGY